MISVVISAKEGSERLQRKDMVEFRSKPLVQNSIDYAFSERGQLVVSDDKKILKLAKPLGAETLVEPDHLLNLHTFDVVKYAAVELKSNVANLQPSSSVRSPELIHQALELLKTHDCVHAGMSLKCFFSRQTRQNCQSRISGKRHSP